MCSIFYPGDIFLENASCYRVIALHTRRSVCVLPNKVLPGKPRARAHARTRAKVVISCSTFSNVDHGYSIREHTYNLCCLFRKFVCRHIGCPFGFDIRVNMEELDVNFLPLVYEILKRYSTMAFFKQYIEEICSFNS